jgi:hypothetical protein
MGYYWARAEADYKMLPLAESALASRVGASKAGQMSGVKRRAKAEAKWQQAVRRTAVKIRAANPGVSQTALTTEIIFLLGEDAVPSQPIIVGYIRKLEREGLLPRREKASARKSNM